MNALCLPALVAEAFLYQEHSYRGGIPSVVAVLCVVYL